MKVLKALIEIEHPSSLSTNFIGYPQLWIDNKERIPMIMMPTDRSEDIEMNGKLYQPLFPLVPDDLFDAFLKIDGFSEPDPVELQTFADKHAPQTEIFEERIFNKIVLKFINGEELTQKDRDAIDPASPERGVTLSKGFINLAKEYGADNI